MEQTVIEHLKAQAEQYTELRDLRRKRIDELTIDLAKAQHDAIVFDNLAMDYARAAERLEAAE